MIEVSARVAKLNVASLTGTPWSSGISQTNLNAAVRAPLLDRLTRGQALRLLERLRRGRLVIHEAWAAQGGETCAFGQPQERADICAHVVIEDPSLYRRLLRHGSIGVGEAYMAGAWHSPDLLSVLRLFALNMPLVTAMEQQNPLLSQLLRRVAHGLNRNNLGGSRKNIGAHYDLSNEFFALFLDRSMMYSAAIYPQDGATLDAAAAYKNQHICERLQLSAEDHLLEIGTGWGALAIHAAKYFGCRVTTTTLSEQQYSYARERIAEQGLEDRITPLLRDYRELTGSYDKLVSVEMIEAVGHQYYAEYFNRCSALLAPDGLMLIQAITIADQRYQAATRSVDFIQRYIFPGGCLPSLSVIASHVARDTDMQIVGVEDITLHYARTLAHWRERFQARRAEVKALGFDEVFMRMWEFYLVYCEAGFLERVIGTAQVLMAKPDCRSLPAPTTISADPEAPARMKMGFSR